LYDVIDRSPRVFLCSESRILASDSAVLSQLRSEALHWPLAIFASDKNAREIHNEQDPNASATIERANANDVSIAATTTVPSYLVLTDTYYPGWICEVDGRQTDILRCNYAMRAVYLAPGRHQVVFRFQPPLFRIALVISGLTAIGLLAALLGFWKIEKRRAHDL
jgi:uncharacterized membrane protein YfhO